MMSDTLIAYKGFNADWTCRGFQYEIGESFEHEEKVEACGSGFHACEHPLNVFDYYAPAESKFALVELGGDMVREDGGDTKVAASKITIKAELQLSELVEAAVKHVFDAAKWLKNSTATKDKHAASATGNWGAASATGGRGAASATGGRGAASATGDWGAASATGGRGAASATGGRGAASATGYQGAASATGYQGAASATGYQGAASATGNWGAASATGGRGAASATGDWGAASATGDWGAASATGYQGAASATGYQGAAMASGFEGRVLGKNGCALFLCERDEGGEISNVWAGIAGRDGIKADTWYTLENGVSVEKEAA